MNSTVQALPPRSFIRRWWPVMLLGVIVLVTFIGWRLLTDHWANSAIREPYSEVIRAFASQSPRAQSRLDAYYLKYQRQTVSGRHYPKLCRELEKLAANDGIVAKTLPGEKRLSACPRYLDENEEL